MKVLGKIARSIPGFRQLSSNSMIIAATYYIVAIFILAQYWYWGLALLAAPFFIFYLLDLNDKKRRRLSLAVSIIAGVVVLLGTAGGLAGHSHPAAGNLLRQSSPPARVVATRAPAESTATPSAADTTVSSTKAAASASAQGSASPQGQFAYVSAKGSKIFHLPGCASAKRIKAENLIGFKTREEAVAAGLTPCQRCKP